MTEAKPRSLGIEGLVALLEQADPASPFVQHARKLLDDLLLPDPGRVPAPTPLGPERFLTIGMATYDDYDGVYFSVQAIRLFHPEITPETEILVLDNHPGGPCSAALKQLETYVENYRYVPYGSCTGTAARDALFRQANSPYVLSMDSHVLFAPGALSKLVASLKAHPDSNDLWHGPMLGDELKHLSTHFEPVWSEGMYGVWGHDDRGDDPDGPPFEIGMQGLGVFACRKNAWPGFNPRLNGFGGEEGYIHEKIRRAGGAVYCLPFLRWVHRFHRPMGIPYRPNWRDRIRNYAVTHDELGQDAAPMASHFEQFLGASQARPLLDAARQEIAGPFHSFDAVYWIGPERPPDLDAKFRYFRVIETPAVPEVGRVMTHRAILFEASWQGLKNVLILPQATAYDRVVFDRVLRDVPETPSDIAVWLRKQESLDKYLAAVLPR